MLILTRQPYQSLMIGDDIKITILELNKGQQIRIGIEAPKEIPVHREEVYQKIKEQDEIWQNH